MTQLSLGYRNHWNKFILNMAFYWLLGFYLPSSLSTASHIVGILGNPGGCLKSVWDSFWAHALWDNASVCILFPTLPTRTPAGWQLLWLMLSSRGRALPNALATQHTVTQKGNGVFPCVMLCWGEASSCRSCLGSVVVQSLVTLLFQFYLFFFLGKHTTPR